MSIVNQKGGFYRTLEVNRDSSNKSQTTLIEPILKQAENYVVHVERFITNIIPPLNQIDEAFLSIAKRAQINDEGNVDAYNDTEDAPDPEEFYIDSERTVTEVARQLINSSRPGLSITVTPDMRLKIRMTPEFSATGYIKLGKTFSTLLDLPEYMFFFRGDDFNDGSRLVTSGKENLFDEVDFFRDSVDFEAGDPTSFTFESGESLVKLDTRQFLDITFTMPHISQLTVVDGVEERKKLLARFPLRDHVTSQHTSGNRYDISKVKETLFLGLTDMTKNNPNVHTMLLLPGELQHANVRVESTWLEEGKFKTKPTEFGDLGFWSLKLILCKKVK